MKVNHFATAMIFAIMMSVFFACSDSSPNSPGNNPGSGSNGAADINSQVYSPQCNYDDKTCSLDTPYDGSGVVKGAFLSGDGRQVLGMMDMGTVNNGKINLEFHIPKEEFLDKGIELRLYSNNEFVGSLFPMSANFSRDNDIIGIYSYFPEDYEYKETWDLFPNQDVMFIVDIDVKRGWNLIYEKNEYRDIDGREVHMVIKMSNPDILNGTELKWVLLAPEMH
jgi:hypothetical protein